MIKREITPNEWAALGNDDQELYEESGGSYQFIGANPKKILQAKQHEKERANKAKAENNKLREQLDELKGLKDEVDELTGDETSDKTASKTQPQLDALKKKLAKQKEDYTKQLKSRDDSLMQTQLEATIKDVVHRTFADKHIGELVVKERIGVEMVDGLAKLRLKDRSGDVSDELTVDKLVEDLSADDRYRGQTITGSKAGGGGWQPTDGERPTAAGDISSSNVIKERFFGGREPDTLSDTEFQQAAQRYAEAGGVGRAEPLNIPVTDLTGKGAVQI